MATKLLLQRCCVKPSPTPALASFSRHQTILPRKLELNLHLSGSTLLRTTRKWRSPTVVYAALRPLDLTEENIAKVLEDSRVELAQLFDKSVGITGQAELADLDGPYVKLRLRGKFWHKRSTVLARLGNYLKQRIPEILEVDIEDEKQLDDSPENF